MSNIIQDYQPLTIKQKFKKLVGPIHLFSFTIPHYSKINWAELVKYRTMIEFVCFIILLWSFYCPVIQGPDVTVDERILTIVIAVQYIIDIIMTFFAIPTLYTNFICTIIYPINLILLLVRQLFSIRWKIIVSVYLLFVSNTLIFLISILHIIFTLCKYNDATIY